MAIKHSKQRDAILAELSSRNDNPTAEDIYFSLKSKMPNLSLGTVYRNLNMLFDDGVIQKICFGGADHFEATTENHYHFLCTKCKKIFNVPLPIMENLETEAAKYVDGTIETHRLIFLGVCKNCQH